MNQTTQSLRRKAPQQIRALSSDSFVFYPANTRRVVAAEQKPSDAASLAFYPSPGADRAAYHSKASLQQQQQGCFNTLLMHASMRSSPQRIQARAFSFDSLSFYPVQNHRTRALEAPAETPVEHSFAFYPSQGADRAAYKSKKAAAEAVAKAEELIEQQQQQTPVESTQWNGFFAQFVTPQAAKKQARMMHSRKPTK